MQTQCLPGRDGGGTQAHVSVDWNGGKSLFRTIPSFLAHVKRIVCLRFYVLDGRHVIFEQKGDSRALFLLSRLKQIPNEERLTGKDIVVMLLGSLVEA